MFRVQRIDLVFTANYKAIRISCGPREVLPRLFAIKDAIVDIIL